MYDLERPTRAGREAVIRGPDHADYVSIGGEAMLPRQFEVMFWPMEGELGPVHRAGFAVVNGRPVCTVAGALMWDPEDREVQSADLRAIRIEDMLDHAEEWIGAKASTPDPSGWSIGPEVRGTTSRAVRQARRRVNDDLLREVATVYQAHIDGAPVAAVEEAFGVSRRTASLYVKKAREAGCIAEMASERGL